MYCKYCGERIEDGSRVCRYCGKEQKQKGNVHAEGDYNVNSIAIRGGTYIGSKARTPQSISISGQAGAQIKKTVGITDRSTNIDNRGGLIQRSAIGSSEGRIRICPYCGKELNLPKPPRFCPYCGEQMK